MQHLIRVLAIAAAVDWMGAAVVSAQPPAPEARYSPPSSWREIVTPDFIVTGNAPTGDLRRTLSELLRFRDSLAALFQARPSPARSPPMSW